MSSVHNDWKMSDLAIALVLVSLGLFISVCLNVILCIRQRGTFCKDTRKCCPPNSSEGDTLSQVERQYVCDVNHQEEEENPRNHHERQENPIYGNISTDRRGSSEDCYEMMTAQRTRESKKPLEPDLNYASLDLKIAKKRMKHRHLQGQVQGRNKHQDQLQDHLTPQTNSFLEVDADADAHLPPRDTSTMVSHSSIYLNSQQIAQEAEELERERSVNVEIENLAWERMHDCVEGGGRGWHENQQSEDRKDDGSIGNSGVQHLEVESSHSFSADCA